jgi:Tfp pilus assembly PilM family ATPase
MSISGSVVAVSLDQDRLLVLSASVGDRVRVRGWAAAATPRGMDMRDGAAVGAWIRKEMESAGVQGSRVVFVVPRGEVVLKRLSLPRAAGVGASELSGMVRLQMARQLTMAIESTAIDYVPIGEESVPEGVGRTDILAGAMPSERMQFLQSAASAARLKVERVGLRSAGAAALLAAASARRNGPMLGIALGPASIEFVVVDAGRLVFARSVDIGLGSMSGEESGAFAERVAVEAKRTWMSYRVGPESAQVDAVGVLGEGAFAAEIARRCGEAMEVSWESVSLPSAVEFPDGMPEQDRLMAAPLAGLLGEGIFTTETLDFANPRKPPDKAAARRQLALLAILLLIVLGGGAAVFGKQHLRRLEQDADTARQRRARLAEDYGRFLVREARLRHMEQWTRSGVDWVAHAAWLSDLMPDTRVAQLESFIGRLSADVKFVPKDGAYAGGTWEIRRAATITLAGPTRDRETANDLRARLVGSQVYSVDSKGADVPRRFSFELTTDQPVPTPPPRPEPAPAGKEGAR